jgi:glycosyltransferase involved in cell wall biosynthesis
MAECAVIVPLYRNAANVPALLERLVLLHSTVPGGIEAVCVVDGSPDDCHAQLAAALPRMPFASRLLLLSRNFGSFAAIRAGLGATDAPYTAVMAADLQEPASLVETFFQVLRDEPVDVALGTRVARADGLVERLSSGLFWGAYRRFVQRELPRGGIDVFACNAAFRAHLLRFREANSSLVGQLLWLGFRRREVPYARQAREVGRSAWTLGRKLRYLSDSVFSFSDLPIRAFIALGGLGLALAALFGLAVLVARLAGLVDVPGYAATVVTILFFSGLNLLGLGIIGSYVWRAYENTKARPLDVVMDERRFEPGSAP